MKHLSRKVLVALLAVAAVLSLCAVSVFAGQQAVGVGTVTGKMARIRSGTEVSSPVATTLDQGTKLSVLGKSGDWYRVKYDDVTGYVADTCIKYVTAAYDLKTTGLVTGESAAIHSDSSLSSSKVGTVDNGVQVDISGFEDGWYKVTHDGQTGYIRSDNLTINGKPPAPVEPAKNDTKNDAKKTKTESNIGTITADEVRLRSSQNVHTDNVIVAMSKGDTVKILEKLDGWYKVAFKIHEGYVSSDFVSVDGSDPAPQKSTADTKTTDKKSTEKTDKKSTKKSDSSQAANNNDSSIIAVGIVDTAGVRIRKSAGTDSKILTSLDKGTAVSILGKKDGWYKVNYDGQNGYMSSDYVSAKTSTSKLSTYGYVKADVLNMRAKPSTDSKRLASFANGLYLDVSGFENGWYKASYGDYSGYVSGDFITLVESVPEPEPEPVQETSSNNSSGSSSTTKSSGGGTSNLPSGKSAGNGSGSSSEIVNYAEQFLGVPYVYGGASPSGFDCSGFVMYVYKHFGYNLPHGATAQLNYGSSVSRGNLQPGDIVLFHGTGGDTDPASHAGIYIGGSQFIHASSGSSTHCVTISSLNENYYSYHYLTGRRLG